MLSILAPAKVNLTLEVLGRRPDGYHNIVSIFQAIGLSDVLTLEVASDIALACQPAELEGPDNLVWQAATRLRERFGVRQGARLYLRKNIPLASGLGGGSSDAAAALRGLAQLWGLGLAPQDLVEIALSLGSDVPFFLYGGTALVGGRGEKVAPLPSLSPSWAVVLRPDLSGLALEGKTGRMYAALSPGDFTSGEATAQLGRALSRGQGLDSSLLHNSFEAAASRLFPELKGYRQHLLDAGASWALLAGSGPAWFTLLPRREEAEAVWQRLRGQGLEAYMAPTLGG